MASFNLLALKQDRRPTGGRPNNPSAGEGEGKC
jgi:hypothetical protein